MVKLSAKQSKLIAKHEKVLRRVLKDCGRSDDNFFDVDRLSIKTSCQFWQADEAGYENDFYIEVPIVANDIEHQWNDFASKIDLFRRIIEAKFTSLGVSIVYGPKSANSVLCVETPVLMLRANVYIYE